MDIIENWNCFNQRIKEERPELIEFLLKTHMASFDELRANGNSISISGKPIAQITNGMSGNEKLDFLANICSQMVSVNGNLFEKNFNIQYADEFPNGVFIVISAIIENSEGAFNTIYPGQKMIINFVYETTENGVGVLGEKLNMLETYYPWVKVNINASHKEQYKSDSDRYVDVRRFKTVFVSDNVSLIDRMRMVYIGKVFRGNLNVNDTVMLTEGNGHIITLQCTVLGIHTRTGESLSTITAGDTVYEVLVSNQLPKGDYNGLLLLRTEDDIKRIDNKRNNETKERKGLFSKFKK